MQELPVIDKEDIRPVRLVVGGDPVRKWVTAIAQDNYGFIWLGSDDGLYRYDGYTLKSYRHDPANPRSLSNNTVKVIYKGRAGILWIGTGFGGLDRLDPALDVFTHYAHDPNDNGSLRNDTVGAICQDRAGSLWVGTNDGIDRLDAASGRFRHYDPGRLAPSKVVTAFYEDHQGNLWVGSTKGLYTLEPSSGRFSLFPNDSIVPGFQSRGYVSSFEEDRSGILWVASIMPPRLFALDVKSGKFTQFGFRGEEPGSGDFRGIATIHQARDGTLWLGTIRHGLLRFDPAGRCFIRYPTKGDSREGPGIATILEDSEGNLWTGGTGGVSRFRPALPVVNYERDPHYPNSLRSDAVFAVHADASGFLWIGTSAGLHRLNRKTGQMVLYRHDSKDPSSLSHNDVSAIGEGSAGELWIGTHGGGVDRFDPVSGRFFAYRHNPKDPLSLSSDRVQCLWVDGGGVLWIGTHDSGLSRLDLSTGHFKSYRNDPHDAQSLSEDNVREIIGDREGTLWIGTNHGLNRLDRGSERFTVYLHDGHNPASLSHNSIGSIYEDRQGTLWVGTRNGLDRLDRNRGSFESFTANDGIADDAIEAIREDKQGNLWLATHQGLSEFHPQTKAVHNYTAADGLLGNFVNPHGEDRSCVTPEGELVFGSDYGVTILSPDRVRPNPYAPPVALTDFFLHNKPVHPDRDSPLQQAIWATRSVNLNHSQSNFTLEFAALSYVAPERNRYRYRLEGLETGWHEADNQRRQVTYTNVPPGQYTFRVQGSNNDLLWNDAGANLAITLLPPWWGTWWFRSIAFMGVALLAFAAYQSRIRNLRRNASRLELQVAERTRELEIARDAADAASRAKSSFLANMSHELRTPLNAILGFSGLLRDEEVSEKKRKDLDIVNRSGEHLLSLINNLLDLAKIEAGRMELQVDPCDLGRLVMDVADMMEVRATEKNLTLRFIQAPEFPRFARTDAEKLREVLINLLGNAIKFTEEGVITLRLSCSPADSGPRRITFEVADTGIGIAEEEQKLIFDAFVQAGKLRRQKGTGLGLAISRQFVELMGGSIRVESAPGKGSLFRVDLPFDPAEESDVPPSQNEREQIIGVEPGRPDFRVLIVEDVEENRLVLQRLMQNAGFNVRLAEDGEQGIEVYKTWRPHFIWIDLRMPGMDGKETAQRFRRLDGGSDVKIAAVTASANASERDEILAAGMDDFVRKPYRASEIFDCMARHLGLLRVYDKPRQEEQPGVLRKDDLEAIPPELVRELADTIVTLDPKRIRTVIARISNCDRNVGRKLASLADRFGYSAILEAAEACNNAGGKPV